MLPTAVMPVSTFLRGDLRNDHEVPESRRNVLVAAGAEVDLVRLVGLDALHRDRPVERKAGHPNRAHASRTRQATTAAPTIR